MTKRAKLSKWAETAFQTDWELWRTRTNEGMVVLGKLSDGTFTLHRFNDEQTDVPRNRFANRNDAVPVPTRASHARFLQSLLLIWTLIRYIVVIWRLVLS